jgi:AraC family transcriptional regulator
MAGTLGKIHDVKEELARHAGAIVTLTALPAGRSVGRHVHDNPYLALHLLGSYRDSGDDGEAAINGPAALFFARGSAHEMVIGAAGLATVIIEFDAALLARAPGLRDLAHSRRWVGGTVGDRATRLARAWLSPETEPRRFGLTLDFLRGAVATPARRSAPSWLAELDARIEAERDAPDVARWAREIGVARPWLARAYRAWRGEGLAETLRRKRVERAALVMEETDLPLAEIAIQSGFCDQSHMNRAFNTVIGRTPAEVRAARLGLGRPSVLIPAAR